VIGMSPIFTKYGERATHRKNERVSNEKLKWSLFSSTPSAYPEVLMPWRWVNRIHVVELLPGNLMFSPQYMGDSSQHRNERGAPGI
jgi:hypothetical protein